jgi:hypothetical protein
MNGAGRAIHAAVWTAGGHEGPGGNAMPELYERLVAQQSNREYDGAG